MNQINENDLSEFIQKLLAEASSTISPDKVLLFSNDKLPETIDVQTFVESNGNYNINIRPECLSDDYKISHEILHLCVRKFVPNFVRVIEPNIVGMIGMELQGYLEHNWILAEQKRRGLQIDELDLYSKIEQTLESDHEEAEKNFNIILTLNNILHTYPSVYEKHKDYINKNNPKSLKISKKIISHYNNQELYSNYEARKATIQAIKEWNDYFCTTSMKSVNLKILLSIVPVFSSAQLKRSAGVVLGLIPNAIINNQNETASHVLYTMNDGQCCVVFSMDENGLKAIENYLHRMSLEEFLDMAKIPFLLR